MKSEIINREKQNIINWDKSQFVICGSTIVATNGNHTDEFFEGVCITAGHPDSYKLEEDWSKTAFKLIPEEGITIKFTNK